MTGSASEGGSLPGIDTRVIAALTELGFSQYEARTYAGLIGREPMTGYAIAKDTLVPQPKVYETLGRLVERGAVLQVSGSRPNSWPSRPPACWVSWNGQFRQRLATVELEVSRMRRESDQVQELRLYKETNSWIAIVSAASHLISGASERIYVSGHGSYLDALGEEIPAADRRGVRTDVLCFGEPPFSLPNGVVIRHSSTDGVVYRHHQSRHLAVTCDTAAALWALAPEGDKWEAVWSDSDSLLTALVKGFIRHDIFSQRMFRDFSTEMLAQVRRRPGGTVRPAPGGCRGGHAPGHRKAGHRGTGRSPARLSRKTGRTYRPAGRLSPACPDSAGHGEGRCSGGRTARRGPRRFQLDVAPLTLYCACVMFPTLPTRVVSSVTSTRDAAVFCARAASSRASNCW